MKKWQLAVFCVLITAALCAPDKDTAMKVDATVKLQEEIRYIALTFDDGPKGGTTGRLLDGLRERGAAATFFLVGDQAVLYPDLVRRMKEEGHQVGNHTWSHRRLVGDPLQMQAEINKMDQLLREILGEGEYWLRPPYGLIDETAAKQVTVPMVKWSVDPRDWESRSREKITAAILGSVSPNSIVLLHDIYDASVDAALEVVDRLQEQGYWFVTVEELLRINGIVPQAGELYRSGA